MLWLHPVHRYFLNYLLVLQLTGTVKISALGALQIAVTTHKLRNQMYEEIKIYLL